ncbi:MAG: diguanylate cyclase [Nocardioidaceae bacterium]
MDTDVGLDLVQTGVQVGCLALAWTFVLRRRQILRLGWGLLVLAVTILALGNATAVLENHRWHLQGTYLVPSTLLSLAGYALLGVAVLQLERHRGRGRRLPGSIEAAIFATGALTPVLVLLVVPVFGDADPVRRVVVVLYALADLVVVTVIARLLLTDVRRSRSVLFLSAALFTSLAGDLVAWTTTGGISAHQGPMVKVLWLIGFVLFAAGVVHPSMVTFTAGGAWAQEAPRRRRIWLMGIGQVLPALTLLMVWGKAEVAGGSLVLEDLAIVGLGGLVVSVLVSLRMHGLLDRISEQSSRLAGLARSDELTGLHNRRSWNFELDRACRSAAAEGRALGVALIDLDHFKRYNDSFGHPAGDRLLRAAADAWRDALEPGEVLARYGGEEFAMLVPGGDLDRAVRRLDRLRALTPGGQTFSAGVAAWVVGVDPEQAVADADAALYQAKRAGRNRVVAFRDGAEPAPHLPYSLRTVVQPIVRARDLTVTAYEALSRFDPATDVEAVFEQAHQEGYGDVLESSAILSGLRLPSRPEGVELFVNVSERAMVSALFWQTLPPRLDGIVVELHEVRHGLDDGSLSRLLDRFRDRGARICLDDLVCTPEDLDRLVSLRPDMVKIDRSLVTDCDTRPDLVGQLERLARQADRHGVAVCAEGVETVAELRLLRQLGIGYVQGFLLGRPEGHWIEPLQPSSLVGPLLEPRPARAAVTGRSAG